MRATAIARAGIVDRITRLTAQVQERIETEFGGRLAALICPVTGDVVEGCTSQGGKLRTDLGVSELFRVVRRLLVHFLATLAPLAGKVLLVVCPGNHGDVRREGRPRRLIAGMSRR
jgi:hypothetical protein